MFVGMLVRAGGHSPSTEHHFALVTKTEDSDIDDSDEVSLEARVRPGARNLLAVDLWVDVLLEARGAAWCWDDKDAYS